MNEQGGPIATLNATAHELKINGSKGAGACYRISEQRQELEGTTHDDRVTLRVSQNPRTGGYYIHYSLAALNASGTHKVASKVAGTCNNPFNKPLDQTTPVENVTLDSGPLVDIEAQADSENPNSLVGSKTVTTAMPRGGEMNTTVTWQVEKSGKLLIGNGGPYWTIFATFSCRHRQNDQFLVTVARYLIMEKQLIVLGYVKHAT